MRRISAAQRARCPASIVLPYANYPSDIVVSTLLMVCPAFDPLQRMWFPAHSGTYASPNLAALESHLAPWQPGGKQDRRDRRVWLEGFVIETPSRCHKQHHSGAA